MKSERRRKFGKALIFVVLLTTLAFVSVGCASAATHYVNPGDSIQGAVDAASDGDTIIVHDGTYTENVDVNKRLTIRSENGFASTTVQAQSASDHVFEVTANYVNISGFTVTGATDRCSGIFLSYRVNHCNIFDNNVTNNKQGIYLFSSNNNTITSNIASNCDTGIYLYSSSHNTVTNNIASNCDTTGISLSSSSHNTVTNNIASNNTYDGFRLSSSSHNMLTNNTANSNNEHGIFLFPSSNYNTLTSNIASDNNEHGICLYSSSHNTVTNNTANLNNRRGISLVVSSEYNTVTNNIANLNNGGIVLGSSNNTLTNNTANSNNDGIHVDSSSNNTLTNNTANTNTKYGIHLFNADNNNISCNLVAHNEQGGFYLFYGSTGNNISYNNIMENGELQADGSYHWNFFNLQDDPVEAKHNYWVATDNEMIDKSIYDDEEGKGKVEFYPFATEPVPCAPGPEPEPEEPDLIVESITANCGYMFANESNEICAKITNIGAATGASNARFVLSDGYSEVVPVPALAAGANTTVCITDPTIRTLDDMVTITVTADCYGEVVESDETNNEMIASETVVNNGYKGKRYTGGEDITTWKTFELNGNLLYSLGDSYYLSAYSYPDWTTYTVSWTASDLPVPGIATVEEARLYVPYTWDKAGVMPDKVSLTFNGEVQSLDAHYSDEKMHATSYPYGMLAYSVTADFDASGNIAVLTNSHLGGNNVSIRGMLLVVVYADDSEPQRKIFMNEEFDLLYGGSGKCTTPAEATAYAPFGAIDLPVESATLITVAPGAGPTEGELIFNDQTWTDVWSFSTAAQIGIDERDVTSYLQPTDNEAGFQSSADYMEASNAILIVEYKHKPMPTISIYTDKTSYKAGEEMHLGLDVKNPLDSAQNVGIDIWLEMPAYPWTYTLIHVPSIKLPAGLDYSNPAFKVIKLPPIASGTYTWYAQLSNPITGEIICEDTAEWEFISTRAPTEDITEVLGQTTVVIDFDEKTWRNDA